MHKPLRVSGDHKRRSNILTERQIQLRRDLEGIQYLNRGLAGVIRYKQTRVGISPLNQSVSEHVVAIDNLADYFEKSVVHYNLNWVKIKKMIKLHDLGEIGNKEDVIAPDKTETDAEHEINGLQTILSKLPEAFREGLIELINEKEERLTPEGRFVHLLDKLEASITIATEGGVQEVKIVNRSIGQVGESFKTYVRQYNLGNIHLANEWGFPEIAEFWEVVWQKQIELGILDDENKHEEPVQLKFEFR